MSDYTMDKMHMREIEEKYYKEKQKMYNLDIDRLMEELLNPKKEIDTTSSTTSKQSKPDKPEPEKVNKVKYDRALNVLTEISDVIKNI
jgi:hypothetical protein